MGFKSEALEPSYHWAEAYCHMECPYCKVHNVVSLGNLDDITSIDVEACKCHGCSKKFWLPGAKDIHETNSGLDWDLDRAELGVQDKSKGKKDSSKDEEIEAAAIASVVEGKVTTTDGHTCSTCGNLTIKAGSCNVCSTCGTTTGCG